MTAAGSDGAIGAPAWPQVSGRPPLIGALDAASDRYLRGCVAALQAGLGDDLIGAYLYSSGAMGDFVAGRSDLDMVAVVRDPLPRDRALRLADAVRAVAPPFPTKGLDLTVVSASSAAGRQDPIPRIELKVLTFYGEARTADDEPLGDNRVVMHFACCRDHGIAVAGPPPQEVFAPVSRREYLLALRRELNRVWMTPHYTVLNACRDLRFVMEGVICSKVAGGLWALERGYDPWLVEAALSWQVHGIGPIIDGTLVDAFAGIVAARIDAAVAAGSLPPAEAAAASGSGALAGTMTEAIALLPDPTTLRAELGRRPDGYELAFGESPLVSCILVAGADPAATLRSVGWFAAQDYPARELIVVAPQSTADTLRAAVAGHDEVRVVVGPDGARPGAWIGDWRDAGGAYARGALLALWDEWAWYAPWRLRYQVGALLRTSHEVSASTAVIRWDPVAGRCWPQRSNPVVGARSLVAATVCLTRAAWRRAPFSRRGAANPADPTMLDAPGTATHIPRGAHFAVLVSPHVWVEDVWPVQYPPDAVDVLLGSATHAFAGDPVLQQPPVPQQPPARPGTAPGPVRTEWDAAPPLPPPTPLTPPAPPTALTPPAPHLADPEPAQDSPDTPLIVAAFGAPSAAQPSGQPDARPAAAAPAIIWGGRVAPLVSCIMPTFNRRRFIAQSVRSFARQNYPNLELVVVDDGDEPVEDLLRDVPNCRYVRLEHRITIGQKRNVACDAASGEIVVQWDDDDWYGPHRVSRQVSEIVNGNADMSGIGVNLLLDVRQMRIWSTREREASEPLFGSIEGIAGGTLTFAKDLWRAVGGYSDASLGEDVGLLRLAADAGARIAPLTNNGSYVYIRHGRNSWRYDFDPAQGPAGWNPSSPPPAMDDADLAFYAALGAAPKSQVPSGEAAQGG